MSRRAPAMAPDERRAAIIAATVPLIHRYGRSVSTRQIAKAAGIAEGTIFRVFETKDELVDAALGAALDPDPLIAAIRAIPHEGDLRGRMIALVTVIQERFTEVFALLRTMEIIGPPPHYADVNWRERMRAAQLRLVEGDEHRLRMPPERFLHHLRLHTFAGSHELIADGSLLTPEEIVALVLDGALVHSSSPHLDDVCPSGSQAASASHRMDEN